MIVQFDSITQYNNKFDDIFKDGNGKKGFSCSYFGLLTVWKFLNGYNTDIEEHNKTIEESVLLSNIIGTVMGINFDELLINYTNINPSKVMATNVELINSNIIGFEHILTYDPKNKSKSAVLFLKNEKYFVVLIEVDKNVSFKIRDSHESTQYNFSTFDELVDHLKKSYHFTELIKFGDIDYSNYSSIEFIKLNDSFTTSLSDILGLCPNKEKYQFYKQEDISIQKNISLSKNNISNFEIKQKEFEVINNSNDDYELICFE